MARDLPYEISITNELTGEKRTWWATERTMKIIRRALRAHKAVPQYIAERFFF